ncbi:MAG: hypothetical protein HQK91_15105 [Nitrospirae bacterium]|nr:hypothetical protein [Nitrospirota bacterium]
MFSKEIVYEKEVQIVKTNRVVQVTNLNPLSMRFQFNGFKGTSPFAGV